MVPYDALWCPLVPCGALLASRCRVAARQSTQVLDTHFSQLSHKRLKNLRKLWIQSLSGTFVDFPEGASPPETPKSRPPASVIDD